MIVKDEDNLVYEITKRGKDIIVKLVHSNENLNELHNKQIKKEKNGNQSK